MSRLFHVNAFSQHPFGGNPAIVVLGPERSDAELQAMAAEFNLSETAFLTPLGEAHYRLRWFTPTVEVDLCGHGTLAAAHVLWQTGAVARSQVLRFETRSGLLEASAEGEWIRLDFPRIPLAPLTLDPAYAEALGCTPLQTLAAGAKFLLVLGNADMAAANDVIVQLHQAVQRLTVSSGEQDLSTTVSIGLTVHQPGENFDEVLLRADRALLSAKRKGRNMVCRR